MQYVCLRKTGLLVYKMFKAEIIIIPALKPYSNKKVQCCGLITAFTCCKTQYIIFCSNFFYFFDELNIFNILSVTQYPLTTFIVANIIAKNPNMATNGNCVVLPNVTIAPIIVMPDIAFDPDINGVCNCDGTFRINSNPKNPARIKMKTIDTKSTR